jgi:hypothetical protein
MYFHKSSGMNVMEFRNFARFGVRHSSGRIRKRSQESQFGICGGQNGSGIVFFYVFSHRSLNAILAKSKNCPFGVNTTYIRQQWHLTGYVSTNKFAGIVGCSCYISQLNTFLLAYSMEQSPS